jgi:hypothetical protein
MQREYLIVAQSQDKTIARHCATQTEASGSIKALSRLGYHFFKLMRFDRNTKFYVGDERLDKVVNAALKVVQP